MADAGGCKDEDAGAVKNRFFRLFRYIHNLNCIYNQWRLLKNWISLSCFFAACSELNVPKFLRFPVLGLILREYRRYWPEESLRITMFVHVQRTKQIVKNSAVSSKCLLIMNELRAASSQPYAKVADADADKDQFFQKHSAAYKEYDFVSPFLSLMRSASRFPHLSAQEKQDWVQSMHKEMIERAGYDEVEKPMALASAMPLIDVLLNISSGRSIFVRDSMSFYRYIRHDHDYQIDVPGFIQCALESLKEEVAQRSAVHLLEIFRDTCFMYLRNRTAEELAFMALKQIDWTPQEKGQFEKLLPFLLKGFEGAERACFRFTDTEERDERCGCCIIL